MVVLVMVTAGCDRSARDAQDQQNRWDAGRTITATGVGEAIGTIDAMIANIGVEAEDSDAGRAGEASSKRQQAISDSLTGVDVDVEIVKTTLVPQGERLRSSGSVKLTIHDLVAAPALLATALSVTTPTGASTHLQDVSYRAADMARLRRQARDRAFADAERQAQGIARALGTTLGDPQPSNPTLDTVDVTALPAVRVTASFGWTPR